MNKLLIILLLLFAFQHSSLQSQNIDSLINLLDTQKKDTVRLKTLDKIVRFYNRNAPLKALPYSIEAVKLAENQTEEEFLLNAYNQLGITYYFLANTKKSIEFFLKVLKIYEQKKDSLGISRLLNNIGISYYSSKAYEKAVEYYKKSLKIKLKIKDTATIWTTYVNIGMSYNAQNENKKALSYYNMGLNSWKELRLNKNEDYAAILGEIGVCYSAMDSLKKAEEFLNESIFYLKNKNNYRAANIILELAKVDLKNGKIYTAESNLIEAITFAKESGAFGILPDCYSELAAVEEVRGNFKKALEYKKWQLIASDSILKNQNLKEMNQLQEMYLIEKQEAEALILKKELEFSKITIVRNRIIIAGTIISLLIVLSISFYLTRNIRKRKVANQKLRVQQNLINEVNEELRQQKAAIESQAEELLLANKKLIEHDKFKEGMVNMIVHDLKNPLNKIINTTKEQEVKQAGKRMLNMVMNILDVNKSEKSRMTLHLRNNNIVDIVHKAINEVLYLANEKNIVLKVNFHDNAVFKVDAEVIERVFVNLLTNAIKYTPVNEEIIIDSVRDNENLLKIRVIDNGSGIPKEKEELVFAEFGQIITKKEGGVRSSGLGLTFCKVAIEAHGGQVGFESNNGKGTIFWFTFPASKVVEFEHANKIEEKTVTNQIHIHFTDEEKNYLLSFVKSLKSVELYSISELRRKLGEIKDTTPNITIWKAKLLDAAHSMNHELFLELLNRLQ